MAKGSSSPRHYSGHPFFAQGFRPFFLAAGTWAALAVPLWLAFYGGTVDAGLSDPLGWHIHEMIWGFGAATITGFVLTAVPNWTGRLPMRGGGLIFLFVLWLIGRVAMLAEAHLGPWSGALDSLFMIAMAIVIWREIIAGKNWRNSVVAIALTLLAVANICLHLSQYVFTEGHVDPAAIQRLAIAGIVGLILLIGGRVTPSFTRNWLAKRGAERLPAPMGKLDMICLILAFAGLAAWVARPDHDISRMLLILGGAATLLRLSRWQGLRCFAEPLVLILHIGYLWAAIGQVLVGLDGTGWVGEISGVHGLTAGAIGVMTLAVMTRATLGHSGKPLAADPATNGIYVLINLAALTRCFGGTVPAIEPYYVSVSGWLWFAAFALFVISYGKYFLARR